MPSAPVLLDGTLQRIATGEAGGIRLVVSRRSTAGDGYLAPDDFERSLDPLIDAATRQIGTDLRHVGAQWLFERYAWQLGSVVAAGLVAEARLIDVARDAVLIGSWEGLAWGLGVSSPRVFITRRDVAVGDPDARVVHDVPALASLASESLASHLEPLIAAIVARRLRPTRALWRAAGDRIASAFIWAAAAFNAEDRANTFAERVMVDAPFAVQLVSAIDANGMRRHVRTTCCLNHRVPAAPLCFGCPRARRVTTAPP